MMAQGGYSSTDEESEDIDDSFILPFMNPAVTFFEKQGDEKFQAKMYEEASMCYTAAMEEPIMPFIDISIISERLFRKRAGCFLKMGNYLDAIQDSEKAIQVANNHNNPNLAKSVYIKMKAIISLEDYPPAFPLALWYKHLLPNCEKTRAVLNDLKEKLTEEFTKDESVIDEVLFEMLSFAHGMTMDPDTLELALECYTELLDLLDFLIIPEVQLRQAKCLLQSGRCDEAKVACAKVLWFAGDNVDALSLMGEITRQIREREMRQAKEMNCKALQGLRWKKERRRMWPS